MPMKSATITNVTIVPSVVSALTVIPEMISVASQMATALTAKRISMPVPIVSPMVWHRATNLQPVSAVAIERTDQLLLELGWRHRGPAHRSLVDHADHAGLGTGHPRLL